MYKSKGTRIVKNLSKPTLEFQGTLDFQGLKIRLESFCKENLEKRLNQNFSTEAPPGFRLFVF